MTSTLASLGLALLISMARRDPAHIIQPLRSAKPDDAPARLRDDRRAIDPDEKRRRQRDLKKIIGRPHRVVGK